MPILHKNPQVLSLTWQNHSVVVLGLINGIFVISWKSPEYLFLSIYLYGFRIVKQKCIKLNSNCLCPIQIFLPLHKQLLKYKEYYISLEHHRTRLSWGNSCEYFTWKHLISLHHKQSPLRWWGVFLLGRVLDFPEKDEHREIFETLMLGSAF